MSKIPLDVLPPLSLAEHLSFLAQSYAQSVNSYQVCPSGHFLQSILHVAFHSGIVPEDYVEYSVSSQNFKVSQLEAIFTIDNTVRSSVSNSQPSPHVDLPVRFEDVVVPENIDAEYIANIFLLAGCSPWAETTENSETLPPSLSLALTVGASGFVNQSRKMANMSWPDLMSKRMHHFDMSVLSFVSSDIRAQKVLEKAVLDGFKLSGSDIPSILSKAHPSFLTILLGCSEGFNELHIKKIQKSWSLRSRDGDIPSGKLPEMLNLLSTASGNFSNSQEVISNSYILKLLSPSWSNYANPAPSFDVHSRSEIAYGLAGLLTRSITTTGSFSGDWSGLTAAAAGYLRAAIRSGCHHFDIKGWVRSNSNGYAQPDVKITPGCLSSAVGFDWRPGIPSDGIVWLAIRGYYGDSVSVNIQDFGVLAGIDNMTAWETASLRSAADFTKVILSKPTYNSTATLASVWHKALSSSDVQEILKSWTLEDRFSLFYTLTGNFMTLGHPRKTLEEENAKLANLLVPDLLSVSTEILSDINSNDTRLHMAVAVALSLVKSHVYDSSDKSSFSALSQKWKKVTLKLLSDIHEAVPGSVSRQVSDIMLAWATTLNRQGFKDLDELPISLPSLLSWCKASTLSSHLAPPAKTTKTQIKL